MEFSEDNKLTIPNGLQKEYSTPISENGKYLSRTAMNAIANLCLQGLAFHSYGGYETFRNGISYPMGAILSWNLGDSIYLVRSTKSNNTDNFVSNTSYIGTSWEIVSAIGNVILYPRINIEAYRERTYTIKTSTGYTAKSNIMWIIPRQAAYQWVEVKPKGSDNWIRIPLISTWTHGTSTYRFYTTGSIFLQKGDSIRLNKDATLAYYSIRER